jgi:hypothetical protein
MPREMADVSSLEIDRVSVARMKDRDASKGPAFDLSRHFGWDHCAEQQRNEDPDPSHPPYPPHLPKHPRHPASVPNRHTPIRDTDAPESANPLVPLAERADEAR